VNVLERHRFTGVIEAIGEFRRAEAVSALVLTLEDDFCRSFAEDALLKIGVLARPALIDAARTPNPSGSNESATSRSRRRSALRLLQNMQFTARDWPLLAALLYDRDAEIAARTGMTALKFGDEQDQRIAIRRLVEALSTADWLLQGEVENCLDEHFDIAHSFIYAEIERRRLGKFEVQPVDNVSRLLLAIVDRHAQRKVV
jgi:HEAT repeat protein